MIKERPGGSSLARAQALWTGCGRGCFVGQRGGGGVLGGRARGAAQAPYHSAVCSAPPSAAAAILNPPFCARSSGGKDRGSVSAHGSLRASEAKLTPRKKKRRDLILLPRFCLYPAETVTGLCGEDGRPPDGCGGEVMTSVHRWPRQIKRHDRAMCTGVARGETAHCDMSWGCC